MNDKQIIVCLNQLKKGVKKIWGGGMMAAKELLCRQMRQTFDLFFFLFSINSVQFHLIDLNVKSEHVYVDGMLGW